MIPTFNQAAYLPKAIESALAQDYGNLEVVVSDDCSTDNTQEIVGRFLQDPKVRYFKNPVNIGRVANYRKTLDEWTTGDYVLNLDGDDWLSNVNYISRAVRVLDENPEVVVALGRKLDFDEERNLLSERKFARRCTSILEGRDVLLWYGTKREIPIVHLSALYRRADALKAGVYRTDLISADLECLLKLIVNRKVYYVDEVVGVWRQHARNASVIDTVGAYVQRMAYVDLVYEYACQVGSIERRLLTKWRNNCWAQRNLDYLYHLVTSRTYRTIPQFLAALWKENPIYWPLLIDPRVLWRKLMYRVM